MSKIFSTGEYRPCKHILSLKFIFKDEMPNIHQSWCQLITAYKVFQLLTVLAHITMCDYFLLPQHCGIVFYASFPSLLFFSLLLGNCFKHISSDTSPPEELMCSWSSWGSRVRRRTQQREYVATYEVLTGGSGLWPTRYAPSLLLNYPHGNSFFLYPRKNA